MPGDQKPPRTTRAQPGSSPSRIRFFPSSDPAFTPESRRFLDVFAGERTRRRRGHSPPKPSSTRLPAVFPLHHATPPPLATTIIVPFSLSLEFLLPLSVNFLLPVLAPPSLLLSTTRPSFPTPLPSGWGRGVGKLGPAPEPRWRLSWRVGQGQASPGLRPAQGAYSGAEQGAFEGAEATWHLVRHPKSGRLVGAYWLPSRPACRRSRLTSALTLTVSDDRSWRMVCRASQRHR
jgi:hypothetical protein